MLVEIAPILLLAINSVLSNFEPDNKIKLPLPWFIE